MVNINGLIDALNALNATMTAFPDNGLIIVRAFAGLFTGFLLILACFRI